MNYLDRKYTIFYMSTVFERFQTEIATLFIQRLDTTRNKEMFWFSFLFTRNSKFTVCVVSTVAARKNGDL